MAWERKLSEIGNLVHKPTVIVSAQEKQRETMKRENEAEVKLLKVRASTWTRSNKPTAMELPDLFGDLPPMEEHEWSWNVWQVRRKPRGNPASHIPGNRGTSAGGVGCYDGSEELWIDRSHGGNPNMEGRGEQHIRTSGEPGVIIDEWSHTPASSSTRERGVERMGALKGLERL